MNDWMKVEKQTPEKPELARLARDCKVSRGEAFLAWFRAWAWLDGLSADGRLRDVTPADFDEAARLPGAAASLEAAGWLVWHEAGLDVTNYTRHNGKSAKARALDQRRQRIHRETT